MVTCWERADILALLCEMFSCVSSFSQYLVLGQVWYFIVSIPEICLLSDFITVSVVAQYILVKSFITSLFLDQCLIRLYYLLHIQAICVFYLFMIYT